VGPLLIDLDGVDNCCEIDNFIISQLVGEHHHFFLLDDFFGGLGDVGGREVR